MTTQEHVEYAENRLGVHSTHESLTAATAKMRDARQQLMQLQYRARELNGKLDERTIAIRSEAAQDAPERESIAAYERRLSGLVEADEEIARLKRELSETVGKRDFMEAEVRQLEFEARGHTARLTELGAYLNYLAAHKELQKTALSFGVQPLVP